MTEKRTVKRQKEPDLAKIKAILDILSQYTEGIWLRELARRAKMPVSTVKFYLDKILTDFVENVGYKTDADRYLGFRLVKLKPRLQGKVLDIEAVRKVMQIKKLLREGK